MLDLSAIEKKWQSRWFDSRIYEAKRNEKPKYFIHFAYPGISGYLHIGHMRGFAYADMIARYKLMKGYNVFFPAGFHASGIPAVSLAKKVERKDEKTIKYLKENGCPPKIIPKLKDPKKVVEYFSKIYREQYWKRFGFLIDYTTLTNTISPGYKKFIKWQFKKLKEKNLLIQKPHFAPYCPNCGPVAVDKSETDISKGGNAEILNFTVIKFRMDDLILPTATLRPETIFGVTNLWVNPSIEYVKFKVGEKIWISSREGMEKISYQKENIKFLEKIEGKDLVKKSCTAPLIDRKIPIISSRVADPAIATGMVMSVPAHAPYDWIALKESGANIESIKIIEMEKEETKEKTEENPAKEICDEMGIEGISDKKLEEATNSLYKKEFHGGRLNDKCGKYAGIKISEIKDEVKNDLIDRNHATVMREFSEEVICRCGERVAIKRVPDQWFIRYGDEEITKIAKEQAKRMDIFPREYKEELPKVLDWFNDRACIRKGSWLGTEFPFKKGWIIEPISDSTLYPIYYIISKFVNDGIIATDEMDDKFFDYVFLGKGRAKNPVWNEIKKEVDYWYPVDINLGGKEHKTVHFPVFLMNHVAVFPSDKWPRGIFVNWWITQKKGKISKSKGGAEPIPHATERYGVDPMRLYYAHVGSSFIDIEWDGSTIENYQKRIFMIWKMANELLEIEGGKREVDEWLKMMMDERIKEATMALDEYDLRKASNLIFFETYNDFQWYLRRGGENEKLLKNVLSKWIQMMAPFTPHLSEELWESIGKKGFVSITNFPQYEGIKMKEAIIGEKLVYNIMEDVAQILKVTKIEPSRIFLYASPKWKWEMIEKGIELEKKGKIEIGTLIKSSMQIPEIRKNAKEASKYAKKVVEQMKKGDISKISKKMDEYSYLKNSKDFLEKEFKAIVEIYDADDPKAPDPGNKKGMAEPMRPAIYVE